MTDTVTEQIAGLSKRTGLDEDLLRQLPDEKLSEYYNRTVGKWSNGAGLWATTVACWGVASALQFATGNIALGFLNASLAFMNTTLAYNKYSDNVRKNEAIGRDIQIELRQIELKAAFENRERKASEETEQSNDNQKPVKRFVMNGPDPD